MDAHGSRATLASLHDAINVVSRRREPSETSGDDRSGSGHAVPRTALLAAREPLALYERARDLQHGAGSAAAALLETIADLARELPRAARARMVRDSRAGWRARCQSGATNRDAVEAWRTPCRRERHARELAGFISPSVLGRSGYLSAQRSRRERLAVDEISTVYSPSGSRSNSGCGTRLPRDRGQLTFSSPRSPVVRQSANAHRCSRARTVRQHRREHRVVRLERVVWLPTLLSEFSDLPV